MLKEKIKQKYQKLINKLRKKKQIEKIKKQNPVQLKMNL